MVKVEDLGTDDDEFLYKNVGSSSSKPCAGPIPLKEVKVEDHDNNGSPDDAFLYKNVGSSISKPSSGPALIKEESPSNSSYDDELRSSFVGMGFSSALVDKVIEENGVGDANLLLESLIKYSKSSPHDSDSWDDFSSLEKEEVNSPIEITSHPKQEMEELSRPYSYAASDRRYHLSMMDFSEKEIDLAMSRLGVNASLPELVDFIVSAQTAGSSRERMNGFADDASGQNEESTTATLFGTMDKTLCLLQMGFTEDEVSSAIDKFGSDVPISELADSIFAKRMAFNVNKEEDLWDDTTVSNGGKKNGFYPDHVTKELPKRCRSITDAWITKAPSSDGGWITKASSSNAYLSDYEDVKTVKKAKPMFMGDNIASCSKTQDDWEPTFDIKPNQYGRVKEEMPFLRSPNLCLNSNGPSKLPYFFYGNVVDVSQGTWRRLSQFLYGTEPEFVNSQFFSALIRKEGYLHNLPTEKRFHILPKPPMMIEDALPHTRKWWPSWDTRKQLSCISSETTGVVQLCDRLGKIMMESQGFLSKEQQTDIIYQCNRFNLIWVGLNRVRPIEPDQVETILGYPKDHTEIWTLQPADRLAALKYCFQTDTIGYHLSVLKSMYPDGIRVLSIFTGVGGAEVALHKLGIWLKCVVSVEASEINQKILKKWWQNTGLVGVLRQIGGIEKLTIQTLENFVNQFGGFDIIIGCNPGDYVRAANRDSSADMDFNLFFEFVRVLQRVRSIMGRNS